ncbi:TfoX/Sxy family protein [Microterricola viridarii]|uniref:Transcriptional regulator of competence genes, TfoX/Sxy family n=1 Tax=Microterricola viridarii TaxID=412690 RepID=A0A1H1VKF8_9MICO|nr:TfoX/Sxy family protein [Microterricola viridarii]SDS85377.1 Transcriptional regulator of competence genes, TfoX/Sxy family [Microterricola viridarii]
MSTSPGTVQFIEDQLGTLAIRTAAMFGEYGIYCDEKIVGLICDDTLFIKPSDAAAELFARTEPAPPYPGAKLYRRVPGEALEDREWLQEAVQATADALPTPPPKKPRTPRGAA